MKTVLSSQARLLSLWIGFILLSHTLADTCNEQTEEACEDPELKMDPFALKLLTAAKESPILVGKHDKKSWLKLFASDGLIQDPVGAPGHYNHGGFYDTFIAQNDISFTEHGDWVDADRMTVYRDVDISIGFGGGGKMVQPAHLVYKFDDDLKVKNLKAHWNMLWSYPYLDESPVLDFAKYGVGATRNFVRVFVNHGAVFGYNYVKGLGAGYFSGGKSCVKKLTKAIRLKDADAIKRLFVSSKAVVELPGNTASTPKTFLESLASKGVTSVRASKIYESGYTTACRITVEEESQEKKGIALLSISDKKISNLTMYWE